MDNYLLYEDENQRIEIDGKFHYYVDHVLIPYINLPSGFIERFVPLAVDRLMREGFDFSDKKVQYWSSAPIFQPNHHAVFSPPFNIFEEAQHYIVETFHLGDNYVELELDLIELYDGIIGADDLFIPMVFPEEIAGVLGCFIYVGEKDVAIMFWTFKED